jgi:serine/threonine-protein kinase
MSPEQVLGREVDHRTDIFSLGTVLYELIAGQRPFLGRTFGEAINNVVNQQPEPLRPDNPLLPESLERIVFRCLEKDPEKRYASARALSEDLNEVRRELEQGAPHPSITAPTPAPAATPAPEKRVNNPVPIWIPASAGLLLLLAAVGAFIASRHMRRPAEPVATKDGGVDLQHRSVAVLPLDNFTGDPENDYLSDGLTEEITTALSRISGLKVAARNSAFAFKGRKQDARKVGEALRVSTLLEGSVRKMGNQIRVTAQLINVADGFHLWTETYDRSADDIIGVQEDIARRIAERLQGKADLPRQPPIDPEAHRLYLQARLYWNRRTEPGLNKAAQFFQQAIDKQPSYAAAHAGLAATYCVLPQYSLAARASKYRPLARASAQRALELDTGCAEAHAVLGHLESEARDYKGAEEHFQSAIRLNPSYATAHHWYGLFLISHGQPEKAATEFLAALELDPLSPIIRTVVAQQHYVARDFDRAIPDLRRVVEDFPEFPVARDSLIAALLLKGRYEDALIEIDQVMALRTSQPLVGLEMKAYAFARLGRLDEAQKIKADLEQRRADGTPVEMPLAFVNLGLREYDKVLDTLDQLFASGDLPCEVLADPMLDEVRKLPRFQQLLKSSGID